MSCSTLNRFQHIDNNLRAHTRLAEGEATAGTVSPLTAGLPDRDEIHPSHHILHKEHGTRWRQGAKTGVVRQVADV